MSTYEDYLPERVLARRLDAISEGVEAAVEANRELREGRLALDPSYTPAPEKVYIVWLGDAIHGVFSKQAEADRVARELFQDIDQPESVYVDFWDVR